MHTVSTLEADCQSEERLDGSVQLVTFRLAGEDYGIEITKVREIILVSKITKIPNAPAYLRGVINLRSKIIPVIDLRNRFALPQAEYTDKTRILVLELHKRMIGVLVDEVCEVLKLPQARITPAPPISANRNQFIDGLAELEGTLIILLDAEKLLSESE